MKPTPEELYLRYVQSCKVLWDHDAPSMEAFEHEITKINGFGGVFSGGTASFLLTRKSS